MRGKRSPDPTLHSDSDLLQHKGPLEAIQNGAPSPLNVMQIMRLSAGLIYQYRGSIPKNFRTKLDKAVRANLDHAMFFMALDEGQRLTLERLRDGDLIGQETFARMSAEFELARRHYVRVAAYKVVGTHERNRSLHRKVRKRTRAAARKEIDPCARFRVANRGRQQSESRAG